MDFSDISRFSEEKRIAYFSSERMYHLVMARQLKRADIEMLSEGADILRQHAETEQGLSKLKGMLSNKRAMLFFNQPSSRTFFSFMNACYILGMSVCDTRNASLTSQKKGESFEDTVRTFASYTDILIIRNSSNESSEKAAFVLNNFEKTVPVINAGAGTKEHPTQALLDIYTIRREFSKAGGVDGKKIVMAGDLKRGRTVRSLCCLLAEFENVELYFAAASEFQMEEDIRSFLQSRNVHFQNVDDMKEMLPEADVVYMTRVQDEHDQEGESSKIDFSRFYFKTEYLGIIKKTAIIMHPLPRREEIPVAVDSDQRAAYWRQEENGMWIRAALIATVFGIDI